MDAECIIEVDFNKFTEEMARETLEFFVWDYDRDGDPFEEFLKKLAIEIFKIGFAGNLSEYGVTEEFKENEGWPKLNSKSGLKLVYLQNFEFDEDNLTMQFKEL